MCILLPVRTVCPACSCMHCRASMSTTVFAFIMVFQYTQQCTGSHSNVPVSISVLMLSRIGTHCGDAAHNRIQLYPSTVHTTMFKYTQLRSGTHSCVPIHTAIPQYTTVSRCTQLCSGTHRRVPVHTAMTQYTQPCLGTHSHAPVHAAVSRYTHKCPGTHSRVTVHTAVSRCAQQYPGTHSSVSVHTAVSRYAQPCPGIHSRTPVHTAVSRFTQPFPGTHSRFSVYNYRMQPHRIRCFDQAPHDQLLHHVTAYRMIWQPATACHSLSQPAAHVAVQPASTVGLRAPGSLRYAPWQLTSLTGTSRNVTRAASTFYGFC